MNRIPLAPIELLGVGDVVSGQDGNKYVVCEKVSILYWEPYTNTTVTTVVTPVVPQSKPTPAPSKPIKKVKEVKEKYYWKDNDKKPRYEGDNWDEMSKSLKPKVSPTKFPAGYVWTTKFSNISYVVDTEYNGYSKTSSRFWNVVYTCPPCLDAEDYPYEYVSGHYCVVYDEQGNKFWTWCCHGDGESFPIQYACKFPEGTYQTTRDGTTYKRTIDDGWVEIHDNDEE
jgi:hypothetical protein